MTSNNVLLLTATITAAPQQVSSELDGEVVILNLRDSTYYSLDEVGALVWAAIQQPRPFAEVVEAVLAEYDVEPAQCEQDLLALLGDLRAAGLIEVSHEATPSISRAIGS